MILKWVAISEGLLTSCSLRLEPPSHLRQPAALGPARPFGRLRRGISGLGDELLTFIVRK